MMNPESTVAQIMTAEVISVLQDDTAIKIREIFDQNAIHHIIVRNGLGVAGIISKNDMLNFFMSPENTGTVVSLNDLKASDLMTPNPLSVESEDTIGLAADIILSNRLHSLPVVEDGELIGILTSHDLLKYCFQ